MRKNEFSLLESQGYEVGVPAVGLVDGAAIDRRICHTSTCEKCGTKGLSYRPFVNRRTNSYRAFTECPNCGEIEEF